MKRFFIAIILSVIGFLIACSCSISSSRTDNGYETTDNAFVYLYDTPSMMVFNPFQESTFHGAPINEETLYSLAKNINTTSTWRDIEPRLNDFGLECVNLSSFIYTDLEQYNGSIEEASIEISNDEKYAILKILGRFDRDSVNVYLIFQKEIQTYSPYIAVKFAGYPEHNYLYDIAGSNWLRAEGTAETGNSTIETYYGWYNINNAATEVVYLNDYLRAFLENDVYITRKISVERQDVTHEKQDGSFSIELLVDFKVSGIYFDDGYETDENDALEKEITIELNYDPSKSAFYTTQDGYKHFMNGEHLTYKQVKELFLNELTVMSGDKYSPRANWANWLLAQ